MFSKKDYQAACSKVTASGDTCLKVLNLVNSENVRRNSGRRLVVFLAAVITLMAVTITAFASMDIAAWFRDYFSDEIGKALTDSQLSYIDENTLGIAQSQTHDGYTVTVEEVFADKYTALFKLKIQCPEGVQFCDSPWGTTVAGIGLIRNSNGEDLGGGMLRKLDDEDPSDNVGYILFTFEVQSTIPDAFTLQDETSYTLQINNLQNIYLEDGEITNEIVAQGPWEFDLDFSGIAMEEVELISDPVDCVVTEDYWYVPKDVPIQIVSFRLRALSVDITFTFNCPEEDQYIHDMLPCTVVMKDGSTVELEEGGNQRYAVEMRCPVPIVLDEVDHVILPDGTKLPMPE